MSKPVNPFDEDQHHSLSNINTVSLRQQPIKLQQQQQKQQQQKVINNICIGVLALLLLASVGILTYRFVQLTQKEQDSHFERVDIQANMQTGDVGKTAHGDGFQNMKGMANDKDISQGKQSQQVQLTNDVKLTQQPNPPTQQQKAQQPILKNQNPVEHTATQSNSGIKSQQQEILQQGTLGPDEQQSEPNFRHSERETETDTGLQSELGKSNSIEEAQLLHEKQAYNIEEMKLKELNNIKAELQLHEKVKKHYQALFTDEENVNEEDKSQTPNVNKQNVPAFNPDYNSKETLEEQQKQTKLEQNQQEPNSQAVQEGQQQQQPQAQQQSQPSKPISSKHISQKDMYDPIIRVKSQIEKKMNTNFDDLYYIKQGTNITEAQYKAAVQRMHLWKFYNPLTKKIQILNDKDVSYEGLDLSTPESTQAVVQKMQRMQQQQKLQFQQKYHTSQYLQIPFCIIIPSYKNQDKYFRNLNSILQQDYTNYHIIYIDDASHDGTAQKVRGYIEKYQVPEERLLFIENKVNKKALPNIDYAARKLCNSGEIMAIIDGDDYLIGTQVFKIINAKYQIDNLLVLYTNHLRVHEPIYLKVGTCIDYPEKIKTTRSFRRFSIFPASHLRTFFVDLYWRISIRDLKDYSGEYFTAANDFAIMMPILEMASDRYEYFPELTYVYDAGTGFNNFQTKADKQARNFKITKRRYKYPKLGRDLQFQKNLRAKGLMKPLEGEEDNPQQRHPSSANRIRRNRGKL